MSGQDAFMKSLLLTLAVIPLWVVTTQAQPAVAPPPTPTPASQESSIKPKRPTVSRPAEFLGPGLLQIEYGYDGNFRAKDLRADQAAALTVSFAASDRFQFEFDLDTVASQTDQTLVRQTAVGDARLGIQTNILPDTTKHPSLAFAYFVKLPTGDAAKGLSTGRADHQILVLTSKKVRGTDIDFNVAFLINGRQDQTGFVTGGQFALGFSHDLKRGFGLQGELFGESKDSDQPQGLFTIGALTYKVNPQLSFDVGVRVGLNRDAPRIGFVAGATFGVVNLYRRNK